MTMNEFLLSIKDLVVNYGSIQALKGVNLDVKKGEIITLVGSNGAGKSTLMNAIMGIVPIKSGNIFYHGSDIAKIDTKKIVKEKIVLVPEGRLIFPALNVYDNLMMGGYLNSDKENQEEIERVFDMFPVSKSRRNQFGSTLSGGEQQMLAVGRAMMAKPQLLLLDEPSLGLAPLIIADIFNMIQRIRDLGVTVLLVEQNARMALRISDRGYVLETGTIVMSDDAKALLKSDVVRNAYLGKEA